MTEKTFKNAPLQARAYQIDLLEHIVQKNVIAYLPTGTGKTFLAVMALKRFSKDMNKTLQDGGKRAIFICNTIELVRQQAAEICKFSSLKVKVCVGESNAARNIYDAHKDVEDNQVLVGTAQTFVHMMVMNKLHISNLSIVVLDECHNGTKNHPMCEFMRLVQSAIEIEKPRILGLTGVLLKGNRNLHDITIPLSALQATFGAQIVTANSKQDFHNILIESKERLLIYGSKFQVTAVESYIEALLNDCYATIRQFNNNDLPVRMSKGLTLKTDPSKIKFVTRLLKSLSFHLEEYGVYCVNFLVATALTDLQLKARQSETNKLRRLYQDVIVILERMQRLIEFKLKECRLPVITESNCSTKRSLHVLEVIYNYSTPKVIALLEHIKRTFGGKQRQDIACLMFVEQRQTAKALTSIINKFVQITPSLTDVLFPNFIIRYDYNNAIKRSWQQMTMKNFRNGIYNMIICSNVLEEGIDVQTCNFVISFDSLKTFNSYIQMKGRARAKDSTFTIFTQKDSRSDLLKQVQSYKKALEKIESFLMGNEEQSNDNLALAEAANDSKFLQKLPLMKTPGGLYLTASFALRLLHHYCQTLPWDPFGPLQPYFSKIITKLGVNVSLKLPLQSRVKEEIQSGWQTNTKLAKISAAFKACSRLYEEGELNEKFLPITKKDCLTAVKDVFFENWQKYSDDAANEKIGRSKRHLYKRSCPAELYNSLPIIGQACFLYEIELIPHFERNKHNAYIFEAFKSSGMTYGLLLRKPLPKLAATPLFLPQGKLQVQMTDKVHKIIIPSSQYLEQLKKHHLILMRDVLQRWRSFYVLDGRNKQNSYLIVPVRNGAINDKLFQRFQILATPLREPTFDYERENQAYSSPKAWLGKVVGKLYGPDMNARYFVTNVINQAKKTPQQHAALSKDLFKSEHNFGEQIDEIIKRQMFLIEAKPLSSRQNFLSNPPILKEHNDQSDSQTIVLIPELCRNFQYPGELWLQSILLPSILHRLQYLLHAEHLRQEVNAFLGVDKLFKEYKPKPLVVDQSLIQTWRTNEIVPSSKKNDALLLFQEKPRLFESNDIIDKKKKQSPTKPKICKNMEMTNKTLISRWRIEILERSLNDAEIICAEQCEFLAALTTACAKDVIDMERFELLGDSFLKFAISLYLMHKYPEWHEGFLTVTRAKIVSNRNLLYCLLETNIPPRICTGLQTHNWLPPLISLPSNLLTFMATKRKQHELITVNDLEDIVLDEGEIYIGTCKETWLSELERKIELKSSIEQSAAAPQAIELDNEYNHYIYMQSRLDKTLSDTLEAILGVCVKNYGIPRAFRMLQFFRICRAMDVGNTTNLLEIKFNSPLLRSNLDASEIDQFLTNYAELEASLGYQFRDRAYLLQALTHPSYPTNRLTGCFQQLEFIGDAILDFLISSYIIEHNVTKTPGMLTSMRSALVNNVTLGCVCVRHRFHLYLLHENLMLAEAVKTFADFQEGQNHRVTDLVRILLEEDDCLDDSFSANIAENVQVPKVLGDIVEALIAAVYFDSRCLRTVWHVIYHLLEQEIIQFSEKVPIEPVRQLYEHPKAKPVFSERFADQENTLVRCTFTSYDNKLVTVNGFGKNKTQAKKSAAKHALQLLKRL